MRYGRSISASLGFAILLVFMAVCLPDPGMASPLFSPGVHYPTGIWPHIVAIGDLDGDTHLDLVTPDYQAHDSKELKAFGTFSVFLGNGDGTFQARVMYAAGDEPLSIAIGDLDGDTHQDLVTANVNSDDISVFLGNGDGTFQAAVTYGAGQVAHGINIGDLDGDTSPDLVVMNSADDDFSVFLNNGDGTFETPVDYATGDNPGWSSIGDLNGDNRVDLAVGNMDSDDISVLLGNGDGTFQAAVTYAAGDKPTFVTIGDFDEDNHPDLAVSDINSNDVSVFINTGCPYDLDDDGHVADYCGGDDCNDINANIYPTNPNAYCDCEDPYPQGTDEICDDGIDNDCDG